MDAGARVTVEKRKWDGALSARWTARLREAGGRIHLWTPAGSHRAHPRRGEDEVLTAHEHAASCGRGWIVTAVLGDAGRLLRYEVDATHGGERVRDGVFAFVDLDLDLVIAGDAEEVQDLAQFARHRRELGYPPEVMRGALRAIDEARELHAAGRWPFDGSLAGAPG